MPPTTEGVDKMGLDEVRDALAISMGWHRHTWTNGGGGWSKEKNPSAKDFSYQLRHPVLATRDAAAEAMPPGWCWEVSMSNWWTDLSGEDQHVNKIMYAAHATRATKDYFDTDGQLVLVDNYDTEIEARFKLALKCLIAMGDAQ